MASAPDIAAVKRSGDPDLQNMDLAGITTCSMSVIWPVNDTGTTPIAPGRSPSKEVVAMAKKPGTEDETSTGSQLLQSVVETIAIRVREARGNAKLRQSDLAALVGTSQSAIYLLEAADANITVKNLVKIAEALQVDPVSLLMDKEAAGLIDKTKVDEFSRLVQSALQELQTTTNNLSRLNDVLQQIHRLLTDQSKILGTTPPSQD